MGRSGSPAPAPSRCDFRLCSAASALKGAASSGVSGPVGGRPAPCRAAGAASASSPSPPPAPATPGPARGPAHRAGGAVASGPCPAGPFPSGAAAAASRAVGRVGQVGEDLGGRPGDGDPLLHARATPREKAAGCGRAGSSAHARAAGPVMESEARGEDGLRVFSRSTGWKVTFAPCLRCRETARPTERPHPASATEQPPDGGSEGYQRACGSRASARRNQVPPQQSASPRHATRSPRTSARSGSSSPASNPAPPRHDGCPMAMSSAVADAAVQGAFGIEQEVGGIETTSQASPGG